MRADVIQLDSPTMDHLLRAHNREESRSVLPQSETCIQLRLPREQKEWSSGQGTQNVTQKGVFDSHEVTETEYLVRSSIVNQDSTTTDMSNVKLAAIMRVVG